MGFALPIAGMLASTGVQAYAAKRQADAQEAQQRYLRQQEAQTRRDRESLAEQMMRPVYTQQQLDNLYKARRDILLKGEKENISKLNESLAARGLGKSGIAEDLLLNLETNRIANIANYKNQLEQQALLANRQKYDQAMAAKAGIQPALQKFQMAQAGIAGQDPYSGFLGSLGSGLSSLGGMYYGQQQKDARLSSILNAMKNKGQSYDNRNLFRGDSSYTPLETKSYNLDGQGFNNMDVLGALGNQLDNRSFDIGS